MIARREKSAKIQQGRQERIKKYPTSQSRREVLDKIDRGLDSLLATWNGCEMSQTEISEWCGVERRAIGHIESVAIRKLRQSELGEWV